MAARRLLIVMVLLLAISTLAAALVPPPEQREETGTGTPSGSTKQEKGDGSASHEHDDGRGKLVEAEVSAQPDGEPDRVRVSPGDQLALAVSSPRAGQVSVPAFGLIGFADRGAPARLDLLVDRPGAFDVRVDGFGTVARIVSQDPDRKGRG